MPRKINPAPISALKEVHFHHAGHRSLEHIRITCHHRLVPTLSQILTEILEKAYDTEGELIGRNWRVVGGEITESLPESNTPGPPIDLEPGDAEAPKTSEMSSNIREMYGSAHKPADIRRASR